MDRRKFIKTALSAPIALGLWRGNLGQLTSNTSSFESSSVSSEPRRSGWINLAEIDEETLGSWWADLNGFELPKEFGEIPKDVNRQDYLRGAFRVLNAFTPEEVANRGWLTKMAPYIEEREKFRPV